MEGVLRLSNSIYCTKEVLGKEFDSVIAKIPCKLYFPRLPIIDETDPKIGIQNPLLPPEKATRWKQKESLCWGSLLSYPTLLSAIHFIAIFTDCEEKENKKVANLIYQGFEKWENALFDYLILTKKQNIEREFNTTRVSSEIDLFDKDFWIIPKGVCIHISVPSDECYANEEQIAKAIHFANTGKELFLEYQLFLSAYNARKRCQNRQAIIDACSAVELGLEKKIIEKTDELGFNSKLFLDKFKSLGDRFDLVKQLDRTFPTEDHQGIIVKPRNDIAHNRETYPSDETTDRLIECVERCLKHLSPDLY